MRFLLDTHIILWALKESKRLPGEAKTYIKNPQNHVLYSSVSVWETAIKHMAHPEQMITSGRRLSELCQEAGYQMLPVTDRHVYMLETLKRAAGAPAHNDPFDRILIAQAKAEGLFLITHDRLLKDYAEDCVIYV